MHQITDMEVIYAFAITLLFIFGLHPLARIIGLTDAPGLRKQHEGSIPLTGGIAIYLALVACLFLFSDADQSSFYFLCATGLIVLVGIIDDRFDLSARLRVAAESIATSVMVFGAGLWVGDLGNLLAFGDIRLPFWIAYPFTLIAVFGIINAINMIDGMDCLAGGISLITVLVLLFVVNNSATLSTIGPFFIGALSAFLLCNYRPHRLLPKVFLGDAGSKLIGLSLVWIIIESTQSEGDKLNNLNPVTVLYVIGLPLMDMVATTIRRVKKGHHPFTADRTHIHHILQRTGLSKWQTIFSIYALTLIIILIGLILQYLQVPEVIQLVCFFGLYWLYADFIKHVKKISGVLKINAHV